MVSGFSTGEIFTTQKTPGWVFLVAAMGHPCIFSSLASRFFSNGREGETTDIQ